MRRIRRVVPLFVLLSLFTSSVIVSGPPPFIGDAAIRFAVEAPPASDVDAAKGCGPLHDYGSLAAPGADVCNGQWTGTYWNGDCEGEPYNC